MRPLQIVGEWAWSAYGRSQQLLDDAQDTQLRLNQMLDDLTSANTRLVRLNRLADGLRQEAEEARRAKEQFVANVSHELRTPLNMIIGFSEMILNAPQAYGASSSGGRLPPALLADLAVILRNARHLASLIDDVLDLSQIEAGQMALVRERVALSEVVEEALVAVRPLFE
jgi:signal transduction histidine kinase